ncbi:MAG: glucan 1,4-alpha-glucosidase [Ktedonobacteraceae bacterium]|nr:glucan 1,4-alpha-glucosidase [Ktedonobacteraceae bacterium]
MLLTERRRTLLSRGIVVIVVLLVLVMLIPRYLQDPAIPSLLTGRAPEGNWTSSVWAPSNNTMLGTSVGAGSNIWFTGHDGIISTVFFPTVDMPNTTALEFLVGDSEHTWVDEEQNDTEAYTRLYNQHSLAWETTNTARNRKYKIEKIIYTDPTRDSLIQKVTFTALKGTLADYLLYVYYDPTIHNSGDKNNSYTMTYKDRVMLVSTDTSRDYASALAASLPFQQDMTSSGFVRFNDGQTDLKGNASCGNDKCPDYTMNYGYDSAQRGNTAQMGLLDLSNDGEVNVTTRSSITFYLVLSFGQNTGGNTATINAQKELDDTLKALALQQNTDLILNMYISQWNSFDDSLKQPPAVGSSARIRAARQQEYYLAANVLKAAQDKQTGAFIAGPGKPWGEMRGDDMVGGHHLVWQRDQYQIASALILAGDTTDPTRALQWSFAKQQQKDGHFPQNSFVSGEPYWTGIQMDEQAYPIMLAWKLGLTDPVTYFQHIKPAADYIVAHGPATPQDRWEENGGYSPATIAVEITGLLCAADIAHTNKDTTSAQRYLETADNYQRNVVKWTYTTNGPLGKDGYFLRLSQNGNPNADAALALFNRAGTYDQREIVDTSFLELVRQGILPASAPVITSSLAVVDATISQTINGNRYWFRYNHDGYGEHNDGYDFDGTGRGRLWPLLSGERGVYAVAAGKDAEPYLTALLAAANRSGMIPEQIWDNAAPGGYQPGQPTKSINPLNRAMAEYIILLVSIAHHSVADAISLTHQRYLTPPEEKQNSKQSSPSPTPTPTPTPVAPVP